MKLIVILIIVAISFVIGIFFGSRESGLFIAPKSTKVGMPITASGVHNTLPGSKNIADETFIELISIETPERYHQLLAKKPVNAYILLGLKLLQQTHIDEEKGQNIKKHLQYINFFMFADLKKRNFEGIATFQTKEEFSTFMFDMIFSGKVVGKNADISEIVANNEEYCKAQGGDDILGCLAQFYFFHAASPVDAQKIDLNQTSFWSNITQDFFTMKFHE